MDGGVLKCTIPSTLRGRALVVAGTLAWGHDDYERCERYSAEGLEVSQQAGDELGAARVGLGLSAMSGSNYAAARRIGDRTSTCTALYNLAQAALSRSDYDEAALLFEEGVTLSAQMRDRANIAYCLEGLAVVANARGETERSGHLIGAAEGLHEAVGVPVYLYYDPYRSRYKQTVAAVRSQLGEEAFVEVRERGREMTFEQAVVYATEREEASTA